MAEWANPAVAFDRPAGCLFRGELHYPETRRETVLVYFFMQLILIRLIIFGQILIYPELPKIYIWLPSTTKNISFLCDFLV